MKKLMTLLILLAFIGCKKDKTTTQKDLCEGIICKNGGSCVNGDCDCKPGFTGPDCSNEVAPIKMNVASIRLLDFPATDTNGGGWDISSGADVFFRIEKDGAVVYTSSYATNLTGPNNWTINFEFSDPTATYVLRVYDYDDFDADDFIGGISFTPYRPGQLFPQTYGLDCNNCVVSFTLSGITYFH